eukprot:7684353-Ditylum_brightwellii.AAC.1
MLYKIKTFTKDQIHSIVQACATDGSSKVRLMGVGISTSYFGLLHKKEILLNFSFNLLAYMTGGLTMYLGELQEPTGCFLKNMHKGAKRIQNMGKSVLTKWPKMAAKMIKVDRTGFTGTCWHRSGTTVMANQE